ncbi:MAG: hypothetical protein LBS21_00710 [Clostridiales bacterium]|nr:hypothetical protein [Clostridiales bacterium]
MLDKKAQNAPWGIYDDSADFHRAMARSDCYYGDNSSAVPLYQKTGNPVMIQMLDNNGSEDNKYPHIKNRKLAFKSTAFDGENYWFANRWYNALIKMNRKSGETQYIGTFPGEAIFQTDLYFGCLYFNGKVYFGPQNAKNIAIYDIEKSQFKTMELRALEELNCQLDRVENNTPRFMFVISDDDKYIYLSPTRSYPAIIRINIQSQEAEYITDYLRAIDERYFKFYEYYSFKKCFVDGDILWIPSSKSNAVIKYNMQTKESLMLVIEDNSIENILVNGGYIGEYLWYNGCFWISLVLPSRSIYFGSILQWDSEQNRIIKHTDLKDVVEYEEGYQLSLLRGIYTDRCFWYVSDYSGKSIKINAFTGEIRSSHKFDSLSMLAREKGEHLSYFTTTFSQNNIICLFASSNLGNIINVMIEYDTKNNSFQRFDLELDKRTADVYLEGINKTELLRKLFMNISQTVLYEAQSDSLYNFSEYICKVLNTQKPETVEEYKPCGGEIYTSVKSLIMD